MAQQAVQVGRQMQQSQGKTQEGQDSWNMAEYLVKEIRGLATRANAPGVSTHPQVEVSRKQGGYIVDCQWTSGETLSFDITVGTQVSTGEEDATA